MSLSIEQDSKYLGKDRWQWSVWLEGDPEELDAIDHVIYILHSTFLDPVRTIDSRSTKFKLEASSWGNFTLHAKAVRKDGREIPLHHELILVYPDGTRTVA
jgi:transcription initiation factor IIF auxiliary subunit